MFKHILFLVISIFFNVGFVSSQNNDEQATKILEAVSKKLNSYTTIKLSFSLLMESYSGKLKMVNEKKGTIWYKKHKYKLTFDNQEIFCDGTNTWNYDKKAKEVQITKYDSTNASLLTPQKLLTDFYNKDFIYKLNQKVRVKNKMFNEIEMTPIDKSKIFFKVYLYIEDKVGIDNISKIKIFEKNGNRYTYSLNGSIKNKKINDDFFVFKANEKTGEKIEVIDLR